MRKRNYYQIHKNKKVKKAKYSKIYSKKRLEIIEEMKVYFDNQSELLKKEKLDHAIQHSITQNLLTIQLLNVIN